MPAITDSINVALYHSGYASWDAAIDLDACSAVDEFDAYLSLVRALLKRGMGEAPTVQLEIANSFSRQFKAVPKWMLTFAAAQNQGCSPLAGLETFKVTNFTCVYQPAHLLPNSTLAF